jgi:hypothetical protein
MQFQKIDMYKPIIADKVGPPPVTINALITLSNASCSEGIPTKTQRIEQYVLLSILPEDLRRRVELAVQTCIAAM